MNLPNKLTMLRVILVPVFMVFAAYSRYGTADFNPTFALIAGIIFAVASFTDFLDGYLARKNNLVTDFGKFMDPLADKCLTTAAFIYMVACGICSPVVLAVILFREFAVAGVRMLAAETGTVIAANMWGKVKTVLQMLTVLFYYFAAALAGPADVMAVRRGHRAFGRHLPVAEPQAVHAGEVKLSWPPLGGGSARRRWGREPCHCPICLGLPRSSLPPALRGHLPRRGRQEES